MNDSLISVQLRVGTNAGRSKKKRKLRLRNIEKIAAGAFKEGYTLIPANGCYNQTPEDAGIVEVFLPLTADTLPKKIFDLDDNICEFWWCW
jgi:hypothetical protein